MDGRDDADGERESRPPDRYGSYAFIVPQTDRRTDPHTGDWSVVSPGRLSIHAPHALTPCVLPSVHTRATQCHSGDPLIRSVALADSLERRATRLEPRPVPAALHWLMGRVGREHADRTTDQTPLSTPPHLASRHAQSAATPSMPPDKFRACAQQMSEATPRQVRVEHSPARERRAASLALKRGSRSRPP